ncbi:hypothetical protein M9978_02300 [Sphingomonas sp. MG17]|uniref:Tip attachment protein J domain-containing protein n=1 Tax=Sphingomonas tagetis TaxID=2949092 RepID=A0A9X2HGR1_9SPHN|nr:hypothetical protein [Sphingomonas tagetis]MCP3729247.1 hypothetical protein [Sphingomonas tagetis]
MAKVLKIAAMVVAVVALTFTGMGLAAGLTLAGASAFGIGVSASTLFLVSAGLSIGASLLAPRPKAPDTSASMKDRLFASINPRAFRTFAFGTTALATDIRDQEFTDDQSYLHRFVVVASHKIHAIREIWFDDKLAWTLAGGAQGEFAGYLTVTPVLEGSAANAINISARMGSARRYTGCAYVHLRYKLTGNTKKAESPFAQSVPSRVTIIGDGAYIYDPRLDSTVGGDGPQRADDQTTWGWDEDACRNPPLVMLTWLLGWRIRNPVTNAWKLAVGKGVPPARIDIASFITAANMCDEPVTKAAGGTEPRYRCDGVFSEGDDTSLVLENFKAAMNAELDDVDGRIRITVLHNDLGTPIAHFTTDDILGEFTWDQTPPLKDTFNIIRGGYTDPSNNSLYQLIDYPEVALPSPDGIDRAETINLPLVESPSQAQRLVKQRLQRAQYPGTFAATWQVTGWKVQKGDPVTVTFKPLGWVAKKFRVADSEQRQDGTVPMVLREEHVDIYAWDADEGPAVQGADPTTYDQGLTPIVQAIGDAGKTADWPEITDPDGTKPADNATNSADPDSPFGLEGTVADALGRVAEAEADVVTLTGGLSAQLLAHAELNRAVESAERQRLIAEDALSVALQRALLEADRTRRVFRDAGITVDPASGQVRLWALDETRDRVSNVEIALSAATAAISLRATQTYVNEKIAEAVIDPSQIAELGDIFTRLTAAELELDGLNASIALKADATTVTGLAGTVTTVAADLDALAGEVALKASSASVTALDTRLSAAEVTITALGNISSVRVELRQARYEADATAENLLRALLEGDKTRRGALTALATARQELTAKINDDLSVEATQRLALAVRVAANEAGLLAEQVTRASADSAFASSLTALSATVTGVAGELDAAVTMLQQADVDDAEAWAAAVATVQVSIDGVAADLDAAVTTLFEAIADETSARGAALTTVNARIDGVEDDLAAGVASLLEAIADEAGARATAVTTLHARIDDTEASITEVSEVAVEANGIAKAIHGVLLDVDGKISGTISENDGETSAFRVRADVFEVSGGTGARTDFVDGLWTVYYPDGSPAIEWGVEDV